MHQQISIMIGTLVYMMIVEIDILGPILLEMLSCQQLQSLMLQHIMLFNIQVNNNYIIIMGCIQLPSFLQDLVIKAIMA